MEKYLFIDGNNLCYRVFWTHRNLTHNQNPVGLLFGFFKNLISLKKIYPEHIFTICWDSKSLRRINESENGVKFGIITGSYKSARKERSQETDDIFKDMFLQMDLLKESLNLINVNQVKIDGFEADDVIYSYAKKLVGECQEIVMLTSDKDYYQVLDDKISIYDPIKKLNITKTSFTDKYGIEPKQWVELGALCGDKGDSIEGADGWGEITALKYIKQYGTLDNVLKAIFEKPIKSKKEEVLLRSKERVYLAKSLKQMDLVGYLPNVCKGKPLDKKDLLEFFIRNGFCTLLLDVGRLIA